MMQQNEMTMAHYFAEFAKIESVLAQAEWLQTAKVAALKTITELGFPTRKNEAWKYTSLDAFHQQNFTCVPKSHATLRDDISVMQLLPYLIEPDCYRVVCVDGMLQPHLSNLQQLPDGLTVQTLVNAFAKQPLPAHLQPAFSESIDTFALLNTLLLQDGLLIQLSAALQLTKPIHILHLATHADTARANYLRQIIDVGRDAQCQVIESYIGLGDTKYCTHSISDVFCADNAFVEHIKIQQENTQCFHYGRLNGYQQQQSTLQAYSLSLGGQWTRQDMHVRLQQQGAHSRLEGLFMGDDKHHIDYQTTVLHQADDTDSYQHFRGILDQQATGVFNGKVNVPQHTHGVTAKQYNKNVLLSPNACMNSKPELEILSDDVQCAHGATVGFLEEAQLFYLQARGIPQNLAKNLLTYAFANAIIRRLPTIALVHYASQQLLSQFKQGDELLEVIA